MDHGYASRWREATGSKEDAAFDIRFLQHISALAERAKFDFVFHGDRLATDPTLQRTNPSQMSRLEPSIAGSSLAAVTTTISIVVTVNPTYYDPVTVARLTASLDHLSGGRAYWNLVTGADEAAAKNFGKTPHLETEASYVRADEFVDVVKGLWDSREHDALDPRASVFISGARIPIAIDSFLQRCRDGLRPA